MQRLLEDIQFRDPTRADRNGALLGGCVPAAVQNILHSLLASSPDPDEVLHLLTRFYQEQRESFDRLAASPEGLSYLAAVFSYSRFLSEAVLRRPEWIEELVGDPSMHRVLTAEEFEKRLEETIGDEDRAPEALTLAVFRRRQILRILLRDVLGFGTLSDATEELSNLADAVLEVTYRRIYKELIRRHGAPRCLGPDGAAAEGG